MGRQIKILYCAFFFTMTVGGATSAQMPSAPAKNWQLMDLGTDKVFGISMEKAYAEFLKAKNMNPVIVAVLDGGVDIDHEDLKPVIWTNEKEIPENGKDDDGNGYIDDIHGWNFYSSMSAGDAEFDIRFLSNQLKAAKAKGSDTLGLYHKLRLKLRPDSVKLVKILDEQRTLKEMLKRIGKDSPVEVDFRTFIPKNEAEFRLQTEMVSGLKMTPGYVWYKLNLLATMTNQYQATMDYNHKQDYDLKTSGPAAMHGTHIAGIIAAVRYNNKGINGIADAVRIMPLKTNGGFDLPIEDREQLLVLAGTGAVNDGPFVKSIHYAVDNGAKVINISFGRRKDLLNGIRLDAINYAKSKDVLIVHAAGNFGQDLDADPANLNLAPDNWVEVGASGPVDDGGLAASFSNYGLKVVDLFAPGVDIYSTTPRSHYQTSSGTSMAAPVVCGLAAMLRVYYPKLTALQVKEILLKSAVKRPVLEEKCKSGGVVNAYEAFKLAAGY